MLKKRILVSYVLLTLVCTVVTGLFVRSGVKESRLTDERRVLTAAAESIDRVTRELRERGEDARLAAVVAEMGRSTLCRVTVVAADGRVLAETDRDPAFVGNHLDRPEIREASAKGMGAAVRTSGTVGRDFLYVARRTEDGAFVRVATPLDRLDEQLAHIDEVVLRGFGLEFVFASLLGWFVATRLTRRIDRQLGVAHRIVAGDLEARVRVEGDDELDALGRAVNRVAERLEAQIKELEARRKEIADVLDSAGDGLVAVNRDDLVTHVNPEAARLFEVGDGAVGRPYWEAVRDPKLPDVVAQVRADLRPRESDVALGGGLLKRELEARVSPIHDAAGAYAGAVLAFRDVTRLRRLEAVRRDFVANVSHEMKTPLTSILGSIETLQDGALDDREAATEFLAKIGRNARSLARLVTDLLELSRIEAGGVRFSSEPVSVASLVDEAEQGVADKAREKGVALVVEAVPPDLEVRGDADLLGRALANLLENAVAYTPAGGRVAVRAKAVEGRAEIAVEDTGIGVPAAELERIFERFYRVDKARSRALGGTGLGLAIVRHVAERHGGAVRVASEVGRGSTFTLSIPLFAES